MAGAATEHALKQYAMLRKAARGEVLAQQASSTRVKSTSATDVADALLEEFGIDVHGMGIATESPAWLLEAALERLTATFEEDYWQDINDTTRDNIEAILYDGIEQGLSIREIADDIGELAPDRAGWRAMNIARTETGNMMNAGHEAGIRELGEDTGIEYEKEWLSVCGTTTRPAHCALDGATVGVDETFDLDGEDARWPGDELLSAENRCNCLCTIISSYAASELDDTDQPDYLTDYGQYGGEAGYDPKAYDPSQPRDEHGQWTDGGAAPADAGSAIEPEREHGGVATIDRAKFKELKSKWAEVNNELLRYVDKPQSSVAKAKTNELKSMVKEMYQLKADPGTLTGIGLPGGPRDMVIVGAGPG